MSASAVVRVLKGRYQLIAQIGRGGMGEVWQARDLNLSGDCAVKIMRDNANPAALDLFNREQNVLAELRSPHIVRIYDRGIIEEDTAKRPFFVMPLLRGKTLGDLIKVSSNRITPEWLVDVVRQVCRGLQSAHNRKIHHRDLKPTNIIVDEDDSVTIIDFGVAHLGDSQNSGFLGTPQYTAPELLDIHSRHEPSPATDLFSLAVVIYEALTRQRPFERGTDRETLQAVITYHPPPVWKLNPDVTVTLGKAIHKGMAKLALHRYSTAKDFADKLQKALRGDSTSEADSTRIGSRFERALKAFNDGDHRTADGMLAELEAEGEVDQGICDLREQVNRAIRERTIYQQLESARALVAQEDAMAVPKLQEVLRIDPQNPEALNLLEEIRQKKTDRDVENWFSLARRYWDVHDYPHAREALREVLAIRRDSRAFEMLADLDGREREFEAVCLEKEKLFQEAQRAYGNGEFSTALSKLERLLVLVPSVGKSGLHERDLAYQDFYNRVHSEREEINNAYAEAHKYLGENVFEKVLEVCARFPQNPLFQSLKLEADEQQRHLRSAYLAEISIQVDRESDLDKRVAILEEAVKRFQADPQFDERLRTAREKRNLVASIVNQARSDEDKGEFNEALGRWEALRKIHPQHPGLSFEIDRVVRQRDRAAAAESLTRWKEQIDRCLLNDDYERASSLCRGALGEFSENIELKERERQARRGLELAAEAQRRLEEAESFISQGLAEEGLRALRSAQEIPVRSPLVRVLLVDTLARHALALVDKDWHEAESLVAEALKLDPSHGPANSLLIPIEGHRRREFVEQSRLGACEMEAAGDLKGAIDVVQRGLAAYPKDSELIPLLERLGKALSLIERPQAVAEMQHLAAAARSVHDLGGMRLILEKAQRLAGAYEGDRELGQIKAQIEQCHSRMKRWSLRGWLAAARDPLDGLTERAKQTNFPRTLRKRVAGWARNLPVGSSGGSLPWLRTYKWRVLAGLSAVLICGIAYLYSTTPIEIIPAEAAATVIHANSPVFAEPTSTATVLYVLPKGSELKVLHLPKSRSDQWVHVQFVENSKGKRPGYVQLSRINALTSELPEKAFQILAVFGPQDSANEPEITQHIKDLAGFRNRFVDSPQSALAALRQAHFYLLLAYQKKDSGRPIEQWEPLLQRAEGELTAVANRPDLASEIGSERRDLASLQTIVGERRRQEQEDAKRNELESRPAASRPKLTPDQQLDRAQQLYDNGSYEPALTLAKSVLRAFPNPPPGFEGSPVRERARALRDLIEKAKAMEEGKSAK